MRGLCFALPVGLAAPAHLLPAVAWGGHAAADDFYAKLAQAEEAEGAGDLVRAGALYDEAYAAMPEAERGGETGSDVVRARVRVGRESFLANPDDPAPLEASSALLTQHIADVSRLDPSRDRAELEKLQSSTAALLERFKDQAEEAVEEEEPAEAEPEDPRPEPTPERNPEPMVDDAPPTKDRRPLGIGLAVGGGVVLVGGIVLLAVGGNLFSATTDTYNGSKDLYPADCTVPGNVCEFAQWRDSEYDRGRIFLGVGAAAAAVGLGLTVAGVVILVKSRGARSTALGPMPLRAGGGLSLRGAF